MIRLHFVKKARKANKNAGIKKGDSYFWWKFRYGPKHCSKTQPPRSALTQSEFLGTMWDIEDTLATVGEDDDFASIVDDAKSQLEELRDETQGKLDNMPEQLQQAETGELLQNRVESCDEMISELEGVDTDVEEVPEEPEQEKGESQEHYDERLEEYETTKTEVSKKRQEVAEEIQGISYNGE